MQEEKGNEIKKILLSMIQSKQKILKTFVKEEINKIYVEVTDNWTKLN